jgi:hypothetical protein
VPGFVGHIPAGTNAAGKYSVGSALLGAGGTVIGILVERLIPGNHTYPHYNYFRIMSAAIGLPYALGV